jgi:hypothetical protein
MPLAIEKNITNISDRFLQNWILCMPLNLSLPAVLSLNAVRTTMIIRLSLSRLLHPENSLEIGAVEHPSLLAIESILDFSCTSSSFGFLYCFD